MPKPTRRDGEVKAGSRGPGGMTGRAGMVLGLLAPAVALAGGMMASRAYVTPFVGFRMFALALPLAAVAILASSIGLFRSRGDRNPSARWRALLGMASAIITLSAVVGLALPTAGYPLINDITTDPDDPPQFVRAATLTPNVGRDLSYPPGFAAQQRAAYPTLGPLDLKVTPQDAFEDAREALEAMPNTRIIAAEPEEGRLEAVSVSRVFHFVDDIVVRIRPIPGGSRIDVRSKSRDGKGDLGVNATRIEALFAILH